MMGLDLKYFSQLLYPMAIDHDHLNQLVLQEYKILGFPCYFKSEQVWYETKTVRKGQIRSICSCFWLHYSKASIALKAENAEEYEHHTSVYARFSSKQEACLLNIVPNSVLICRSALLSIHLTGVTYHNAHLVDMVIEKVCHIESSP